MQPERIGDVQQGADTPDTGTDDLGFTPSERAEWDRMEEEAKNAPQEGQPEAAPAADAPIDGDADDDGAPDPAQAQGQQKQDPQPGEDDDDEQPEPAASKKPGSTVSRHKYTRELTKRDQELATLRQQVADSGISQAKLAERLQILNEALTAPAPQDPAVAREQAVAENPWLEATINVNDDAIAAIAQMQRRQEYNAKQMVETQEFTAADVEDRQLRDSFTRDISAFSTSEQGKGFQDAYAYIKNSRLTEIAVSLYDKDPNDPNEVFTQREISKIIEDFNAEEKWVVKNAIENKRSPAGALMRLAKSRGWKYEEPAAGGAQPAPQARQPAQGNGAAPQQQARQPAPAVRQGANGQGSAVDKINAEIEGAAQARSLSDGGGAPPMEPLAMDKLLKMGDREFAEFVDNISEEKLARLMGKPPEDQLDY